MRTVKYVTSWVLIVIFSLIYFVNVKAANAIESFAEVVQNCHDSVITIYAHMIDGTISQGSGFFIDSEGHVVTNYHVVRKADKIVIKQEVGSDYIGKIIAFDHEADLAILSSDSEFKRFTKIKFLKIAKKPPVVGNRIIVIGSPLGLEQTVSDGLISALRPISGFGDIIQISAPVSAGSSGGPVVNLQGDVVGVATFLIVGGQNLNFAIPGYKIIELINKTESLNIKSHNNLLEMYLRHGSVYANRGKYATAISYYDKAIKINPVSYDAHLMRGLMFFYMMNYYTAASCFTKAIEINPNSAEAYNNRGMAYLEYKDYKRSKNDIEKAIQLNPNDYESYNNLGVIYGIERNYDKALDYYYKALKLIYTMAQVILILQ